MKKILFVLGTRPEAIKLAPVIHYAKQFAAVQFEVAVCVTAQHREMLDQMLDLFEITPDYDLNLMQANQQLTALSSTALTAIDKILEQEQPDWVCVQGDTTTTFISALAAFYRKIRICHIEAGLRSYHKYSPWPEEMNRTLTSHLADLHFAPTEDNQNTLFQEGISSNAIHVVGNTVIDALFYISNKLETPEINQQLQQKFPFINQNSTLLLVTGHRRENFGEGIVQICQALLEIAQTQDVQIVYPVHLNPNVKTIVHQQLGQQANIHLLPPLDYLSFVYLMKKATLILTDSGGIQEEAPTFGVPVLVMRNSTERHEAITAGTAKLVGTKTSYIVDVVNTLLHDKTAYLSMTKQHNPFGDGKSAGRIIQQLIASK